MQVLQGTGVACTTGNRTFIDESAGVTYCLEDVYDLAAGASSGDGAGGTPTPSPTTSGGFAFAFCGPAIPALEQMNATVHKGHVDQFGNLVYPAGVWPGSSTIGHWNKVLLALSRQASSAGQSGVDSDAYDAQMRQGYQPTSDGGLGAIALGNETMNIAMACAPGGPETGSSAVESYQTPDGFTWYPGN
jgi:hypothetical protein